MATSKKSAEKKAPVKRAPRKTTAKKKPVETVEEIEVEQKRGLIERIKANKFWLVVGLCLIAVLTLFVIWLVPNKAERAVKKNQKIENKAAIDLSKVEALQRELDSLKEAVNEQQAQSVSEADAATKDRKEYETQSTKKKEQTKIKYNETNKQIEDAVSSANVDKLDAIRKQQQRAREAARNQVPDSSRIRTTDFRTRGGNKGN